MSSHLPLLATEASANDETSAAPKTARNQGRGGFATKCLFGVGFVFLVFVGCLGIYLAKNGAFQSVSRDVRIVNGTVTEPNTHRVYPVNIRESLDNVPKPHRLVGVFLKTYNVAGAELRVYDQAVYVERAAGRERLKAYKRGPPSQAHDREAFMEFSQMMSSGISVTIIYNMLASPPGSIFADSWLKQLVQVWRDLDTSPERISEMQACFQSWFHHGIKSNDQLTVEYSSRNLQTYLTYNGVPFPTCKDPLFGKAIVLGELIQNGDLSVDLLATLWNSEYDSLLL